MADDGLQAVDRAGAQVFASNLLFSKTTAFGFELRQERDGLDVTFAQVGEG
jgi:hypothetical protein